MGACYRLEKLLLGSSTTSHIPRLSAELLGLDIGVPLVIPGLGLQRVRGCVSLLARGSLRPILRLARPFRRP